MAAEPADLAFHAAFLVCSLLAGEAEERVEPVMGAQRVNRSASERSRPRSTRMTAGLRLMPLWMSSGGGVWSGRCNDLVDLAGDVAFQAAQSLTAGLAFGDAPGKVGAGLWIPAQTRERDAIQRGVGLAVAAAVQAQADGLAGGHLDRAGAAQRGVGGFAAQPLGVVPGGDEQGRGAVGPHPRPREQLLPAGGGGQVLVTSRWTAWGEWATPLRLEVLTREEAVAFLHTRTGSQDQQAAAELADLLGDLPLALAEAAAYVEQTQVSLAEYVQLVRDRAVELFGLAPPAQLAGAQRRVATVWSLSLGQVRQEAPAVEGLLYLCAFLAPDEIPRSLPREHHKVLPEELGKLAGDALAYNNALGVLGRYSLAVVTPDGLSLAPAGPSGPRRGVRRMPSGWGWLVRQPGGCSAGPRGTSGSAGSHSRPGRSPSVP